PIVHSSTSRGMTMTLRSHLHLAIGALAGALAFLSWVQPVGAIACQYKIRTVRDLQAMQSDLAGVYCLVQDIDASKIANFKPVGNDATPFTGRLDGKGHIIRNLKIKSSGTRIGLFGTTLGAVIQDVSLVDEAVTGTGTGAGTGTVASIGGL